MTEKSRRDLEATSDALLKIAEKVVVDAAETLQSQGIDPRVDVGIEVMFLGMMRLVRARGGETAHFIINETIERLNGMRPDIYDPNCCETCNEFNQIIDHLSQKIGTVDNRSFALAVSRTLRIFLDSIRDDDLAAGLEQDVMDNLVPDDDESDDVAPTLH